MSVVEISGTTHETHCWFLTIEPTLAGSSEARREYMYRACRRTLDFEGVWVRAVRELVLEQCFTVRLLDLEPVADVSLRG